MSVDKFDPRILNDSAPKTRRIRGGAKPTNAERIRRLSKVVRAIAAKHLTGLYTQFVLIDLKGEQCCHRASPYNEGDHPRAISYLKRVFVLCGYDSTFRVAQYHEIDPVPMESIDKVVELGPVGSGLNFV